MASVGLLRFGQSPLARVAWLPHRDVIRGSGWRWGDWLGNKSGIVDENAIMGRDTDKERTVVLILLVQIGNQHGLFGSDGTQLELRGKVEKQVVGEGFNEFAELRIGQVAIHKEQYQGLTAPELGAGMVATSVPSPGAAIANRVRAGRAAPWATHE